MSHGTKSLWMDTTDPVRYPKLQQNRTADAVVIGAGQAGVATAYLLAREGADVVVLDKAQPGGGETGRTSAHLTAWVDDGMDLITREHGSAAARHVAASHARAVDWIEQVSQREGIDCGFRRIPAFLFSLRDDRAEWLEAERAACVAAGIPALLDRQPLYDPFGHGLALRLDGQATYHPLRFLHGLARAAANMGVAIHGDTFVSQVDSENDIVTVTTRSGVRIEAKACVVATNTPFTDYANVHTKQAPYRTYVVALTVEPGSVPDAMYFDDGDPYHYCRLIREAGDRELLLVGGEDHKCGQADDGAARLDRLEAWARAHFNGLGERTHGWSGQVFEPADGLGLNGHQPDMEHVYIITGDSGDGLTNAVWGARLVTDLICGRANPLAAVYDPSRRPKSLKQFARENLNVAKVFALDRLTAGLGTGVDDLASGEGRVVRRNGGAVAAYRDDDGTLHECSALCTHMRCVVRWNPLESSWDCPCHGSRFSPTGEVIMGPASSRLEDAD
jgi:glycine/D-amino acid oxidase-like deaminating enzyme/nitrite reductase/ring-hydroxylating ferredoxin subunit